MSLFDSFKVYAQYSQYSQNTDFDSFKAHAQNTQNPQNYTKEGAKDNIEDIEDIEHALPPKQSTTKLQSKSTSPLSTATPIYKKVGRYKSEEHLLNELRIYPRVTPCPKMDWHWQDKELCYKQCKSIPKHCIYHRVAFYKVKS